MSAATPESNGQAASLSVEQIDATVVLRISGELDLRTVPGLQARLFEAVAATAGPVVADLTDVRFLSSTGLHLLVSTHAELAAERRPMRVVTGETRAVVRPLRITGLDRFLGLYADLGSALAAGREPDR